MSRSLDDLADEVAAWFADTTGHPAEGVWASPGRVNLIGDHTDYNGGLAMPLAIDRWTVLAGAARDDGLLTAASRDQSEPATARADDVAGRGGDAVSGWGAYLLGAAWPLARRFGAVAGADLAVVSTVPTGSGLSSSAALCCAGVLALAELMGHVPDPAALIADARAVENDVVGVPVGTLDQTACVRGEVDAALLFDAATGAVTPVHLPVGPADPHRLLVIDTNTGRELSDGRYAARQQECERAAGLLGVDTLSEAAGRDADIAALPAPLAARVRHVVGENARVRAAAAALRASDLTGLGRLLSASHASLAGDYDVSTPVLDGAVEAARAAGALGARLTGAGFGGCAIALVPAGRVGAVDAAVRVRFAAEGWRAPDVFAVRAVAGARRLR